MAITLTLYDVIDIECPTCGRDIARVRTREDYEGARNGAVGSIIIQHALGHPEGGHLASVRNHQRLTWDEMYADRAAQAATTEAPS